MLVPTGFLLCVESWTPALRTVSPTRRGVFPLELSLSGNSFMSTHFTSQLESED